MTDHPLPALRHELLRLHKLLMNAERAAYEAEGNEVRSPMHLLQLLTEHERFAWLRQLSQRVVMLDEAMEEKPPLSRERADALARAARHLLMAGEEPGCFARRYAALREHDAGLRAAQAEIEKLFSLLPE